jgi:dihydrofolate reductase
MSTSVDGFVAGPGQDRENPVGLGGLRLHEWHWHAGDPGHEADIAARDDLMRQRGAYVMGRNMFGPIRGEWDQHWRGWWGEEPPYHAPVFVLTHHPQDPIEMQGGTTFYFVTEGFHAALEQATAAADGRELAIAGGASTVRQALAAGAIDELVLDVVPVLLTQGERLFDGVEDPGSSRSKSSPHRTRHTSAIASAAEDPTIVRPSGPTCFGHRTRIWAHPLLGPALRGGCRVKPSSGVRDGCSCVRRWWWAR